MSRGFSLASRFTGAGSTRVILCLLVALALVIRLGFFLADPNPYDSAGLSNDHGEVARNIVVHGEWFKTNITGSPDLAAKRLQQRQLIDPSDYNYRDEDPTFLPMILQPPGQAAVLAAIWKVTGDFDYGYIQVLQVLIDSLMVLLVWWIAMQLFRRERAALIAAGIYAVFLPLADLARIPHLDIWGVFWTISIVALFLKARGRQWDWRWVLITGAVTGLALYFRPGVLILPGVMAAAMIPWIGWLRAAKIAAATTAVALLLLTPWVIRNYAEFDRLILTRIGIGQNLWEGMGEIPNDFGALLDDAKTAEQVQKVRPDLKYGTPEYDDLLVTWWKDAMADHWPHYGKVVARRAVLSTVLLHNEKWIPIPASDMPSEYASRTDTSVVAYPLHKPLYAAVLGFALGVEPILFCLAIASAWWLRRRYGQQLVLLLAVPVGTVLPYLILHFEPRYVLSASFAYMILVGLGVDELLTRRRLATAEATVA